MTVIPTPQAEIERLTGELDDLREQIQRMEEDWFSPEEHLERVAVEIETALGDANDGVLGVLRPLAKDAHHLLADLAWRATTGEPTAQAIEREVGDFLVRVRDYTV